MFKVHCINKAGNSVLLKGTWAHIPRIGEQILINSKPYNVCNIIHKPTETPSENVSVDIQVIHAR